MEHDITKALEVWTLQTLLNVSILLGILALGLALVQGYYRALEKHLTLRVSIELWRVATVLLVDLILVAVVLVGLLLINPDIMSDIKMAVPFYPIATVLFAAALVLRLFHGGHEAGSKSYRRALCLTALACVVNLAGFTFVAEGSSPEYLDDHPGSRAFWDYVKDHFCSNVGPASLDLAQITFYICFPLLLAVLAWGFFSALKQIQAAKGD
jgi:hypothetical protein